MCCLCPKTVSIGDEPRPGDPFVECVHQPTACAAGQRVWWWALDNGWAALCSHCYSRSALGRDVQILPLWRRVLVSNVSPSVPN